MNNTEKDIIERYQKFDFDKNEYKQAAVLKKINEPVKKSSRFYAKFGLAAVFCVAILAVAIVPLAEKYNAPGDTGRAPAELITEMEEKGAQPVQKQPQAIYKGTQPVQRKPQAIYSAQASEMAKERVMADSNYMAAAGGRSLSSFEGVRGSHGGYAQKSAQAVYYHYAPAPDYNSMQDESYKNYGENTFFSAAADPLSTFSADVDTASYGIVKSAIQSGRKVNPDSVRVEEFINYFNYSYPQPQGKDPVGINFEYSDSPWNKGLKLVKIGVKAKDIEKAALPPGNLVFLIDVSGSMSQENRLPLVKKSLKMLVNELRPQDRVSIVTYASGVRQVLSGAKGSEKEKIIKAIDDLSAGGGTSGSAGLEKAYEEAKKHFMKKGNNRIILATDGDFNIGPSSDAELEKQIVQAKESGIFLSVLGFGMGNYKDSKVQTLANKGNGNYAYINDLLEARKVLVKEFGSTLFTVAKDVKLQVEFNPAEVSAYRLVGYEKRKLENRDFNDDTKDAGEMGAGHTVTVFYEIIPAGVKSEHAPDIDMLKYAQKIEGRDNGEVLTVKLRYKDPASNTSKLIEKSLDKNAYIPFGKSSDDMRFAAAAAQFAQILKDGKYKGTMTLADVLETARKAKGQDDDGYRAEFVRTVELAK